MNVVGVLLVAAFSCGLAADTPHSGIRVAVCPWETFTVNCTEDKMIVIRSTFYGVIGSSRCFAGNLGVPKDNCSTDVTSLVKDRCAKRNHCVIELPDIEYDRLTDCQISQLKYLEIVFQCSDGIERPTCEANFGPDGLIGPNSCSVEPEETRFTCGVDDLDIPVQIHWLKDGNADIIVGNSRRTRDTYLSVLSMKADLSMDGSFYECRASSLTSRCTSHTIKILYVFANNHVIQKKEYDELICIANSSQPCIYKWQYMHGKQFITVSSNQTIIPQQKGLYKCEAECLIRDQNCTVVAMLVQVSSTEETGTLKLALITTAVTVIVCLIISTLLGYRLHRKCKRPVQFPDVATTRDATHCRSKESPETMDGYAVPMSAEY